MQIKYRNWPSEWMRRRRIHRDEDAAQSKMLGAIWLNSRYDNSTSKVPFLDRNEKQTNKNVSTECAIPLFVVSHCFWYTVNISNIAKIATEEGRIVKCKLHNGFCKPKIFLYLIAWNRIRWTKVAHHFNARRKIERWWLFNCFAQIQQIYCLQLVSIKILHIKILHQGYIVNAIFGKERESAKNKYCQRNIPTIWVYLLSC